MKTAIITDSECSLPASVRKKYHVSFVAIRYSIDEDSFVDACTDENALALFKSGVFDRKHEVFTNAPDVAEFEHAIINKIKEGYERIIIQTLNRSQGDSYNNANTGVARVKRQLDGREIALHVMDSRTMFAGQGLMATETIRRLLRSKDEMAVRQEMLKLSEKIHTYILPKDPLVPLERSRQRNEHSIGWAQSLVASKFKIHPIMCNVNDASSRVAKVWGFQNAAQALFKHACKRIDAGLLCPIVTINYCGPLKELEALPGYQSFVDTARAAKIMLLPSVASLASGIYTSVGSLSLALATDTHEWGERSEP